jgi:hypothetical protein
LAFSNKTPAVVQVAYFLSRWQVPNRDAALAIQMPKLYVPKEAANAAGYVKAVSHANMAMIDMSNRRLEPTVGSPQRGIVAKLHSKLAVLLFVSFVGLCANRTSASAAPTGASAVALAASPRAPEAGQLPAVP